MPETLRTQPYEARPSSRLGFADYFRQSAVYMLMPALGAVVGFGLRTITGNAFLNRPFPLGGLKNGEGLGLKIGMVYGAYKIWSASRATQLGVGQVFESVLKLKDIPSANDYLEKENAQLRRQLAFGSEDRPTEKHHAERVRAEKSHAAEQTR